MARIFTMKFQKQIQTSQEALFEFHSNTNNLKKITPKNTNVDIVKLNLPIRENAEIILNIKKFTIEQKWHMKIAKFQFPNSICDESISCPFPYFFHEHNFIKIDEESCILEDIISFALPFYPFSLIALPLIKKDISSMFEYRQNQTKQILENTNGQKI